jgi:hypothetical protein
MLQAVRYFVIGSQGERYGPADLNMLNQWAQEGRLLPTTFLEQEGSPVRFPASTLAGLMFANPVAAAVQQGHLSPTVFGDPNLQRSWDSPAPGKFAGNVAWGSALVSVLYSLGFNCIAFPFGEFFFGAMAVIAAYRAQAQGHPSGRSLVAVTWLALLLAVATFALGRLGIGIGL